MQLLNPSALWLALLVGVLLLAARRKPRKSRAVANLYLWRQAQATVSPPLAVRQLRRHRLLLLQIAFVLTVVAALARPLLTREDTRVAFVVDVSASMGAREGTGTRLDVARQKARAQLAQLSSAARIHVIAAGPTPTEVGDFRPSDAALVAALDRLTPTAASARLPQAVTLARTRLGDRPIYVFSDRGSPALAGAGTVHWTQVGNPTANVAITAFAARRLPTRPADGQVLVEVRNFGAAPQDVPVDITQDDQLIARHTILVPARASRTVVDAVAGIGGVLAAHAMSTDALEVDNHRFAVVPPAERVRLLLEGGDDAFINRALAANPAVAIDRAPRPDTAYEVVVCGKCQRLPPGDAGVLLVRPPDGVSREASRVTPVARGHPVAANLDTGELLAAPAAAMVATESSDVILRSAGGPIVVAYERDARRVVEINVDLAASDLPLATAFPVLIANAVDWLSARDRRPVEAQPGALVRWPLRDGAPRTNPTVVDPAGVAHPVQRVGRQLAFADTAAPGVYRLRGSGSDWPFAVNVEAETASDLAATQTASPLEPWPPSLAPPRQRDMTTALLCVALVLALVEWACWTSQERHRTAVVYRMLAVGALVLGLVGFTLRLGEADLAVMFALDRSDSVPSPVQAESLSRVNRLAGTMRGTDRAGVAVFGINAAIERRPSRGLRVDGVLSTVTGDGTNIEQALRTARSALPADGARRIVLLSDGRETAGHLSREAAEARRLGIPIDVVPLDAGNGAAALSVTAVMAPAEVRIGEPFLVSVDLLGPPGTHGRVVLKRDGALVGAHEAVVGADRRATSAFTDTQRRPGVHTYEALLQADANDSADTTRRPDTGAIVSVVGRPSVLYASRAATGALPDLLGRAGFAVTRIAPTALATAPAGLEAFDAVVLDDPRAAELSDAATHVLTTYVQDSGGGLLVLAGPRSIGIDGASEGGLGRLLPIDLRPRSGRRTPSVGLVVVFDKSGSMADVVDGVPKIEMARQAVAKVLEVLPPSDPVGVIAFDAAPVVIAPLSASHDTAAVQSRLRGLAPGGSTAVAPALTLALDWLRSAPVSARHVLLVSDGRIPSADAERVRRATRTLGFELSAIGIGRDADRAFLEQLAASTGGRSFFPEDVRQLPMLAAREAARAAGGGEVNERFTVRVAGHPIAAGLPHESMPELKGYVVSALKPGADAVLLSHLDDPVLAAWRYGLGRVAVYTAGLGTPWSASLQAWAGVGPLWAQTARWLGRRGRDRGLSVEMTEVDNGSRLVVEAARESGLFASQLHVRATVQSAANAAQDVVLREVAPGRYETRVDTPETGAYMVAVSATDSNGTEDRRIQRGFYRSPDRERRVVGADLAALTELAQSTGGRVLGPSESPFTGPRPANAHNLRDPLVLGGLVLFLADVLVRRGLRWPRRNPALTRLSAA